MLGDVGPTLYKCYTNVLCLLGCPRHHGSHVIHVCITYSHSAVGDAATCHAGAREVVGIQVSKN